jgi:signal transduction histidine kinase
MNDRAHPDAGASASSTPKSPEAAEGPEGTEKTRILSGLTHELRTPLGSILMMSELLAENGAGHLDERETRYAQNIHRAVSDLLKLVDQVGEMARLEAGRVKIEHREVDPAALARRIRESHGVTDEGVERDGPRLSVEVAPDAPRTVRSDPAKILEALDLLLESAAKVSRNGEVRVRLAGAGGAGGDGLAITVQDVGPPLAEGEWAALFVPFAAAGPRSSRQFGGSGLGLPLAHSLVTALGGTIAASCTPDGCSYTVIIPTG